MRTDKSPLFISINKDNKFVCTYFYNMIGTVHIYNLLKVTLKEHNFGP